MKTWNWFGFVLCLLLSISVTNTKGQAGCPVFLKISLKEIARGDSADYTFAVRQLNAYKTCDPTKGRFVDSLVLVVNKSILTQRDNAIIARENAKSALLREQKAKEETKKQFNIAQRNSMISKSQSLATASSNELLQSNPQLSILLAIEAKKTYDSPEARGALLQLFYGGITLPRKILVTPSGVTALTYSPDGRFLVTGHEDRQIRVWDTKANFKLDFTLPTQYEKGSISVLKFDRSGTQLLAYYEDFDKGFLVIWNFNKKAIQFPPLAFDAFLRSVDISADGTKILIVDGLGAERLKLWDIKRRTQIGEEIGLGQAGYASFNDDGTVIGTANWDGNIAFYTVPDLIKLPFISSGRGGRFDKVAFSKKGRIFAAGQGEGIRLFELPANFNCVDSATLKRAPVQLVDTLIASGTPGMTSSIQFLMGDSIVITGNNKGVIKLYNTLGKTLLISPDKAGWETGTNMDSETGAFIDDSDVTSPAPFGKPEITVYKTKQENSPPSVYESVSADGKMIAAAYGNNTLTIWDTPVGKPFQKFRFVSIDRAIADKAGVIAIKRAGHIIVKKIGTEDTLVNMRFQESGYNNQVYIDQHGENVIFANNTGVRLLKVRTKVLEDLKIPEGQEMAFSADGNVLAIRHDDYYVDFYHPQSSHESPFYRLSASFKITAVTLSSDGKQLCAGGTNGRIQVFNTATGIVNSSTLPLAGQVHLLKFGRGDTVFAATTDKQTLSVYRTASGTQKIAPLNGFDDRVISIGFSQDGRYIAAGTDGDDRSLRIWDLQFGIQVGPVIDSREAVKAVAFDMEDRYVYASTPDFPAQRFVFSETLLQKMACAVSGKNFSIDEWERYIGSSEYQMTCSSCGMDSSLFERAKNYAEKGQVAQSVVLFRLIKALDPSFVVGNPQALATEFYSINKARTLAEEGDLNHAVSLLSLAQRLNPKLNIQPLPYAKQLRLKSLLNNGVIAARANDRKTALSYLINASLLLKQGVSLKEEDDYIDYQQELSEEGAASLVAHYALETLLARAEESAKSGNIDLARQFYQQAGIYNARYLKEGDSLAVNKAYEELIKQGNAEVYQKKYADAQATFAKAKALKPDAHIDPQNLINGKKARQMIHDVMFDSEYEVRPPQQYLDSLSIAVSLDPSMQSSKDSLTRKIKLNVYLCQAKAEAEAGRLDTAVSIFAKATGMGHKLDTAAAIYARRLRISALRVQAWKESKNKHATKVDSLIGEMLRLAPFLKKNNELKIANGPWEEEPAIEEFQRYFEGTGFKAYVISYKGSWGWATGCKTYEEALSEAIGYCTKGGITKKDECRVFAKGDDIVWDSHQP